MLLLLSPDDSLLSLNYVCVCESSFDKYWAENKQRRLEGAYIPGKKSGNCNFHLHEKSSAIFYKGLCNVKGPN